MGETDVGRAIFVRELDDLTSYELDGTDGARQPFFSPDGEWIAFFADGQLLRVPIAGGAPIAIATQPPGRTAGGSWSLDGTILFAAGPSLYSVPAAGGEAASFDLILVEGRGSGADPTVKFEASEPIRMLGPGKARRRRSLARRRHWLRNETH